MFSIAANEARSSGEVTELVTDAAKATNAAVNEKMKSRLVVL